MQAHRFTNTANISLVLAVSQNKSGEILFRLDGANGSAGELDAIARVVDREPELRLHLDEVGLLFLHSVRCRRRTTSVRSVVFARGVEGGVKRGIDETGTGGRVTVDSGYGSGWHLPLVLCFSRLPFCFWCGRRRSRRRPPHATRLKHCVQRDLIRGPWSRYVPWLLHQEGIRLDFFHHIRHFAPRLEFPLLQSLRPKTGSTRARRVHDSRRSHKLAALHAACFEFDADSPLLRRLCP